MNRILKVACIFEDGMNPYLFELDQRREIGDVVREICEHAHKSDHTSFAFKFVENDNYITSQNRGSLKDGSVLKLVKSPEGAAIELLEQLSDTTTPRTPEQLLPLYEELAKEAKDSHFSKIFVEKKGLVILQRYVIETIKQRGERAAVNLRVFGLALSAFFYLQMHDEVQKDNPWSAYKDQFFNAVMAFVAEAKGSSVVARAGLLLCSAWVEHTPPARGFNAVYYKIYKGLGAIPIRSDDLDTQEAAVKLINAVIGKATTALRPEVFAKLEKLDVKGALANRVHGQVSLTLAHELSVLQTHLLSEKAERAQYMFSQHDKDCVGKLATLKDGLAQFQDDVRAGASYNAALGYTDAGDKAKDFMAYPGVLALDNLAHFAVRSEELYKKMVLDQLSRDEAYICPFIQTGKRVTALLLEIFNVGDGGHQTPLPSANPVETNSSPPQFLPLFYAVEHPFEQLFGVSLELLFRTWREMEAKRTDMDKVINVVRRQLLAVISNPEKMPTDVQKFKAMVFANTYEDIKVQEALLSEESVNEQLKSDALVDIKSEKRDSMVEVVREQRLNFMCNGAWFHPIHANKGKVRTDQRFFAMLAPSFKELKWSDPEAITESNNSKPTLAELPRTIEVESIVWIEYGTEVPALKESKQKKAIDEYKRLAFAFNLGQEEWLNFVALDRETASKWMDGLRMLKEKRPLEPETRNDVDVLVDMEMNIVLMNLHGVTLPQTKPEVPPLPVDPEPSLSHSLHLGNGDDIDM